jgi:hypothetical protein
MHSSAFHAHKVAGFKRIYRQHLRYLFLGTRYVAQWLVILIRVIRLFNNLRVRISLISMSIIQTGLSTICGYSILACSSSHITVSELLKRNKNWVKDLLKSFMASSHYSHTCDYLWRCTEINLQLQLKMYNISICRSRNTLCKFKDITSSF